MDKGIIGVLGDPVSGYTVRVGAGESLAPVTSLIMDGLSLDAQRYIRIDASTTSATALQASWLDVNAQVPSILSAADTYWMDIDPELAKIVVGVDAQNVTSGQATQIEAIAPGLVQVLREGPSGRAERSTPDAPPHWGGSIIAPEYSPRNYCTAGFSVIRNSTNARASVTAGHCGTPGGNGGAFNSGSYFYGTKAGTTNYPEYDQARLQGSTYDYYIRTNGRGDAQNRRGVRGATDPVIGDMVCQAGVTSYAECDIRIGSLTASLCDAAGCTTHLAAGRRADNTVIVRAGDSGGPVYLRFSGAEAGIRAMVIGYQDSGRRLMAERYKSIANHLDVRILTAP